MKLFTNSEIASQKVINFHYSWNLLPTPLKTIHLSWRIHFTIREGGFECISLFVKFLHYSWNLLPTPLKTIFTFSPIFLSLFVKVVFGVILLFVKNIHYSWSLLLMPLKTFFTFSQRFCFTIRKFVIFSFRL